MTLPHPRPPKQRKQDALGRLDLDVDAWVATADPDGGIPYLVPLSYIWEDGDTMLIATAAASPTGRNLRATGSVRVSVGPTRDVVLIEGTATALPPAELSTELGDLFATKTGFDPRTLTGYLYFRIVPRLIQAWREVNELKGRDLMRDGQWIAV